MLTARRRATKPNVRAPDGEKRAVDKREGVEAGARLCERLQETVQTSTATCAVGPGTGSNASIVLLLFVHRVL